MAEEKKIQEKQKSQIQKIKTSKKVGEKPKTKTTLSLEQVERTNFAKDVAEALGITSYQFLIIKRNFNIDDATLVTSEEMKKYYKEIF